MVGITGGQGVGKSTFASNLRDELEAACPGKISLVAGLGDQLRRCGVPFGSDATALSVAAIYSAHLERELTLPDGIVILDRCCVDALCYVRALGVAGDVMAELYKLVSRTMARSLQLAIHLEMTGVFTETAATHEAPELRRAVADHMPTVLAELGIENMTLNASAPGALSAALTRILALYATPPVR